MRVDYTLPGVLPEVTPTAPPETEPGESHAEPFDSHFQRLHIPEVTDWRTVLRLNISTPAAANIGPPPPPSGIESRDGASQRAWWRGMLHRHVQGYESVPELEDSDASVSQMLGFLSESQRREDAIFARYFAEGLD